MGDDDDNDDSNDDGRCRQVQTAPPALQTNTKIMCNASRSTEGWLIYKNGNAGNV